MPTKQKRIPRLTPEPLDLVSIVERRVAKLGWSMSELDRRANLSIGESRRFLARDRTITHPKVMSILHALGLTIVEAHV